MPTQRTCKLRLLAKSEICELWICADCGTVTLQLGAVSLRLKPCHFNEVVETMGSGLRHLQDFIAGTNEMTATSEIKH